MRAKVLLQALVLLALVYTPGCASTGTSSGKGIGGWFSGLFTVKAADKIQAAEQITGVEKMNNKVADAAAINIGAATTANKTDTRVGRDMTNDSEVMKAYIDANKSAQERLIAAQVKSDNRFMRLLYLFITSLFTLIFKYELQIRRITAKLLDSRDKDDEREEARLDAALKRDKEREVK